VPTVLVELNGIEKIVKSMAIWTVAVGTGCLLATPFSGILPTLNVNYLQIKLVPVLLVILKTDN